MTKRIETARRASLSRRDFLKQAAVTTALLASARTLLPSGAYAAPAVPEVTGAKLGFNFALGAAYAFSRYFEAEVRGAYTMVTFSLPSVAGRADQRGTVIDAYLVLSAGATFRY